MSSRRVVIVDPYSSGASLAESLTARGASVLAVESSTSLPREMRSKFSPDLFAAVIQHDGDLDATERSIAPYRPTHVIAGFESGVELADNLARRFQLPANSPTQREARRDKFLMAEAARRAGLRTPRQFLSSDVRKVVDWIRDNLDWPVILKPPSSVASDHVFCCRSEAEVVRAANLVLSEENILGCHNRGVLAQEFLPGVEYAVDTVSLNGRAKNTAIWEYHRPDRSDFVCYDSMTLLPHDGPRQESLREYAFRLLKALGIEFGPAHCELMWVDHEPVLIEVGARLSAGVNATLSRVCGGSCQLDETVDVLVEPERFLATHGEVPNRERHAANVFVVPPRPGILARLRGLEFISRLPTLHAMSVNANPGDRLTTRTVGLVTLVHENLDAIQRDIQTIRQLVQDEMFEME